MNKTVLTSFAILCLLSTMFLMGLSFNIQTVKAVFYGCIYIKSDGSVFPSGAPIQRNGDLYTLTDNITSMHACGIVIERNNMTLDGAGYTIQGAGYPPNYEPGIYLVGRSNVTIKTANINGHRFGIFLEKSSNNRIIGNRIANNQRGIYLVASSNNTLVENEVTANHYGIDLYASSNHTLFQNNMSGNSYNFGLSGYSFWNFMHSIDTSNIINGKPVYYFINKADLVINPESYPEIGYLGFANCTNITIERLNLTSNIDGLRLTYTHNSRIIANHIANNVDGLWLSFSRNNTLAGNIITTSWGAGLCVRTSSNNTFIGNEVTGNGWLGGIRLLYSSNNTFAENKITNNDSGFDIHESPNNIFRSNNMTENIHNLMLWVNSRSKLTDFANDIDTSNTVDGKPVYYWINRRNMAVPADAGYVALINCTRIISQNLNLTKNGQGILLVNTENSIINQNNITSNRDGVQLFKSSNNTISWNNLANNGVTGIHLSQSSNNTLTGNYMINEWSGIFLRSSNNTRIYHNNLINTRSRAAWKYGSYNNTWDDGYPSGGNYWSDYNGTDLDDDGIGDTPYVTGADCQDDYPLMGMFSSFNTSLEEHVNVISNSTVEDFEYFESNSTIKMYVSNMTVNQTFGFCRVCIPHTLMNETYQVIVNGAEPYYVNYTLYDDGDNRWIYFSYQHSTLEIVIIPEFPSLVILPLFMTATLLAVIVYKRKHSIASKCEELIRISGKV